MSPVAVAHSDRVLSASKSEFAYSWIRERIAAHVFGPGYRLVLGVIADELDMSVVPVREAIRRLEAEGLVTYERNVGARVSVVDEREYIFTMQTLGVVEGFATAITAPHLTSEDFDRATDINDHMRALLDRLDAPSFTRLNHQFHSVLFTSCPNPHILDLVRRGWTRLSGLRDTAFAYIPERASHSVDEHVELLELIRGGTDQSEIETAARNHRLRTLDTFLAARHSGGPRNGETDD